MRPAWVGSKALTARRRGGSGAATSGDYGRFSLISEEFAFLKGIHSQRARAPKKGLRADYARVWQVDFSEIEISIGALDNCLSGSGHTRCTATMMFLSFDDRRMAVFVTSSSRWRRDAMLLRGL